jgi:hypothetical protein
MTLPIGNVPQIPYQSIGGGLRTELGTFAPPGGAVQAYVHSGGQSRISDFSAASTVPNVYTTLNAALRACRSGWGDTVIVLPGHAENISSADQMSNLVAGTRIIGIGNGMNRPTFTWTAATASFLLDVANVRIENCILNMDPGTGTTNVAAPMTISAAGCQLVNNKIRMGTDANSKVTIGITTTAAADDLEFLFNEVYGATAAAATTLIQFVGADRLKFHGNSVAGATSAAVGVIRFLTTASLDIKMFGNVVRNNFALSIGAVTGMAGVSGEVDHLLMCINANTAAAANMVIGGASGAWTTSGGLVAFGLNVSVANNLTTASTAGTRVTPVST